MKANQLLSLLLPVERRKFHYYILLDVLTSIIDVLSLAGLIYILQFILLPQHSQFPYWINIIFQHLVISAILITGLFFLKNLAGYYVNDKEQQFFYQVASRISKEQLDKYYRMPYADYVKVNGSTHFYKISQLPVEFAHYVLRGLHQLYGQSVLIFITITTILLYKPSVFILLSSVLVPVVLMVALILKRKITGLRKNAKKANEVSHQYLDEALHGYVDSKIYQSHNYFTTRYSKKQSILNNYLAGIQSVQMLPARIMETFAIGAFFVLLLSAWNSNSISLSVTTAAAFMAAAYKVIPALSKIINSVTHIQAYKFTIGLLNEHVHNDNISNNDKLIKGIQSVEFKNVSFGYNNSSLIKDFNLKIEKGDFIGFSGLSGRGKTTIINLLLGFHEQMEGKILLNNQDTTGHERATSYKHISYVKQTPFLINESLLKNITLNEVTNESSLNDVLEVTGLTKLINGYKLADNTMIKQEGKNISGGQKQRIAFARGLNKNFDLMILDEPFSELDADSERRMIQYLKSLSDKGKMILLISHNKESFHYCNKTISFDEQ